MKIGDYILLKDYVTTPMFQLRHGRIIHKAQYAINDTRVVEILFPNGITETWHEKSCEVISDKEYFKLQLS